jgi:hypothetical protein
MKLREGGGEGASRRLLTAKRRDRVSLEFIGSLSAICDSSRFAVACALSLAPIVSDLSSEDNDDDHASASPLFAKLGTKLFVWLSCAEAAPLRISVESDCGDQDETRRDGLPERRDAEEIEAVCTTPRRKTPTIVPVMRPRPPPSGERLRRSRRRWRLAHPAPPGVAVAVSLDSGMMPDIAAHRDTGVDREARARR